MIQPDRPQMTLQSEAEKMQYGCSVTEEELYTHTHTHNIISFLRQQWLREAPHYCITSTPHALLNSVEVQLISY
jgi:hypothetical protein